MLSCDDVREMLALQPLIDDMALDKHLDQCQACTTYRRQHQVLDGMLRAELRWEAPAALTARLLAHAIPEAIMPAVEHVPLSAPATALRTPLQPARARPQGWFVTAVYVLTMMIIALSLLVAWQVIGAFTAQFEFGTLLTQVLALPGQAQMYLTQQLPLARYVLDFLQHVRIQLLWLLLVAVLWAVFDKADLQFSFRGRQISL